jgi:hypothetical protein
MARDPQAKVKFQRLERIYRAIWIAFPLYVGFQIWQVVTLPDRLSELDPALRACLQHLPMVQTFSVGGKVSFWAAFAAELTVYGWLLVLAHRILIRCAAGGVFVPDLVRGLRAIAVIITAWPVVDMALQNILLAVLVELRDMPAFTPLFDLDVTVVGVGMLMLTVTTAMGEAVRLREDADLTI